MPYYEQDYRRRISFGQAYNSLVTLISINLIIFVIFAFIKAVYILSSGPAAGPVFEDQVARWFALPADLNTLLHRPWTLITSIFLHLSFWHILGNMIWLWAFGFILHDLTGNKKVVPIFLYGGLAGSIFYILSYNIFPGLSAELPNAVLLGASGGVMAVAMATTTIAPGYRLFPMIFGGIPLWVLTVVYVIADIASIGIDNTGGHLAHLGGAAMGFLFIVGVRRGVDLSDGVNRFFDWVNNLFNPERPRKGKVIKSELFYKSTTKPYQKTPNLTQQKIDDILDKISQKGYQSLSTEEKDLLKRASKEDL